ncbi:MAG: alpha-amylase family glycosyl hydrolase [Isosphaeraceae bacterium]
MAQIWIACALVSAALAAGTAEEATVLRVEPPSWWTSTRTQAISLLIEGRNLDGATVSCDSPSLGIARAEPGPGGRALWVVATIAEGAEAGNLHIDVQSHGQRLRFPWALLPAPREKPHAFGPDDIIYLIMPDRFADGDPRNNAAGDGDSMLDRSSPDAYHGGDFSGIRQRLSYLKDLGVTAIWLTPVYRPEPRWLDMKIGAGIRRMAEYHGYTPVDFYDTNPRFGTPAEYRALVDEAHRLGLKVIQDQTLGYTGPRHRWVHAPPFDGWFHGPIANPPICTFRYDLLANPHASEVERRGVTDGWFFGLLPDLDTRNHRVKRYAIQQSLWWALRFNADGIRLDTYPLVDREFWRDWSRQRETAVPGMSVVGEAWDQDPWKLCFFQGGRAGWDGIDPGVNSVFDFPLNHAIVQVFSAKAPATRLRDVLARDGLYPDPQRLVTFLDNHDTPRLAALPGVGPARYRLAIAFLLTCRGIPQMTWGDEIGLPGHMDDRRDFPGGFAGDKRDAFGGKGRTSEQQATFESWKALIRLRRSSLALRRGRLIDLAAGDTTYAYLREAGAERLVVVFNLGTGAATVQIPTDRIKDTGRFETVYGSCRTRLESAKLIVELPAESAAVLLATGEGALRGKVSFLANTLGATNPTNP